MLFMGMSTLSDDTLLIISHPLSCSCAIESGQVVNIDEPYVLHVAVCWEGECCHMWMLSLENLTMWTVAASCHLNFGAFNLNNATYASSSYS